MIYRLAGSQSALHAINLCILLGIAGIMTEQIQFLSAHFEMNFIPEEVAMEQSIAILLAAFGVFLEHRRYVLERIYPDAIPEPIQQFDHYSHNIGVMMILIAILMEALALLFLAFNSWGFNFAGLKYIEISLLFGINLVASGMLLKFGIRTLKI